jgi:hypothetical protein
MTNDAELAAALAELNRKLDTIIARDRSIINWPQRIDGKSTVPELNSYLSNIGYALARVRDHLQALPLPDPIAFPKSHAPQERRANLYYCSFCGKSQEEVARLIAGPTVFICNECVALCTEIVAGRAE